MKSCFSLLLVLGCLVAKAQILPDQQGQPGNLPGQEQPEDTIPRVREKEHLDFRPTGLRIGTDLIQDIRGFRSNSFNGWEVNADVDLAKYYVTFDYGQWGRQDSIKNGTYTNDGRYWRLGFDVNLIRQNTDRNPGNNMVFVGLRYARSSYSDRATFAVDDQTFGKLQLDLTNPNLSAGWAEVTAGLRVRIWKYVWMGYTGRIKVFPSIKGEGELKSYDIPGYGRADVNNWWGFNYQIFIRIPWRQPEITKWKKK